LIVIGGIKKKCATHDDGRFTGVNYAMDLDLFVKKLICDKTRNNIHG
jgi:hypothetical protein